MNDAASWVEISRSALVHNLTVLRELAGTAALAPVVKANAYGHGLRFCAETFTEQGVDMLCVNELSEAEQLSDLAVPIYVLGPTTTAEASRVAELGCHVVCQSMEQLRALALAAQAQGPTISVHVKVETGTNRQGASAELARAMVAWATSSEGLHVAGVTTHLADVEDETQHNFARLQLERFAAATDDLPSAIVRHVASSAAHILLPESRYGLVRPGLACYGMWPSEETQIASRLVHGEAVQLRSALSWKTRLVSINPARLGEYVGYGRTVRLARNSRLGLLPVGYYDGYDRQLSGRGTVLLRGQRAPILGRVCMNMCLIDVSDVHGANVGDEVVLIGAQGQERIRASDMARWADTINYEVTTRIHPRLIRVGVP
jgi:alanine racemase